MIITELHDHQFCHERVAVGSGVWNERDISLLKESKITHVIDCRSNPGAESLYRGTNINFLWCPTNDDGELKSADWFRKGVSWALDALNNYPNSRILIHCAQGINRGPSMAYALLRMMGHDSWQARKMIEKARPCVGLRYEACADRFVDRECVKLKR